MQRYNITYSPTNINSLVIKKDDRLVKINKIFHKTLSICVKSTIYALYIIVLNIVT